MLGIRVEIAVLSTTTYTCILRLNVTLAASNPYILVRAFMVRDSIVCQ